MPSFKAFIFTAIAGLCVLAIFALLLFSLITRLIWALLIPVLAVVALICAIRAIDHWLFKA